MVKDLGAIEKKRNVTLAYMVVIIVLLQLLVFGLGLGLDGVRGGVSFIL